MAPIYAGILPTMRRTAVRPTIAIIGAGNLGTALALSLQSAGYRVSEIFSLARQSSRRRAQSLARRVRARAMVLGSDVCAADVVWLCVPDREISACATVLARAHSWKNRIALHSSGALSSDELAALRKRGASVASVHPLMTFVRAELPSLARVPFAIEGDARAVRISNRIARDLGGLPFNVSKGKKAAYHAWGFFASPLFTALLVTTEQVAKKAGIPATRTREMMLPILRQTLANYGKHGPDGAFSGPILRGDAQILTKHLQNLRSIPEVRNVYLALARSAVRHLSARNKRQLLKALG